MLGCAREVPAPPPAPDLTALRSAFTEPDGRLDPDTAAALVNNLADLETELVFVGVLSEFFNQVVVALLLIVSCHIYYSAGYLRLPFRISVLLPELHRPMP